MFMVADITPPNSLILVMDQFVGIVPESMNGKLTAATPTCIAIGTLSEHDGPTHITLTDESQGSISGELVFDGVIKTPTGKLAVCTVLDEKILEAVVSQEITRVQIWANDRAEPDIILILVSKQAPVAETTKE